MSLVRYSFFFYHTHIITYTQFSAILADENVQNLSSVRISQSYAELGADTFLSDIKREATKSKFLLKFGF